MYSFLRWKGFRCINVIMRVLCAILPFTILQNPLSLLYVACVMVSFEMLWNYIFPLFIMYFKLLCQYNFSNKMLVRIDGGACLYLFCPHLSRILWSPAYLLGFCRFVNMWIHTHTHTHTHTQMTGLCYYIGLVVNW